MTEINENVAVGEKVPPQQEQYLGRVRISTLHNETEKFSLLNSNAYKGAFLCLVTYSHLP
ncbi:hypothetical protein ACET57_19925 [Aeromonas veronii]